jgi:hypothetical protein
MSNTQDPKEQKLEAMLQSRRFEPASSDLAERIIHKAQHLPQHQMVSLSQWIRELFTDFHLPRPAYVLVSTLIFGFVVGFTIPQYTTPTTDDADAIPVQSFLYADEDML